MFAQVDALPGAHIQAAVGDGDGQAVVHHRSFDMGGHIIYAFVGMPIVWLVFRYHDIHMLFKIMSYIRGGVLVYSQGSGSVTDKDMGESHPERRQFRDLVCDLMGHQMESTRFRRQSKLFLHPGHGLSDSVCY